MTDFGKSLTYPIYSAWVEGKLVDRSSVQNILPFLRRVYRNYPDKVKLWGIQRKAGGRIEQIQFEDLPI